MLQKHHKRWAAVPCDPFQSLILAWRKILLCANEVQESSA